jgi:hypothetical protein
MTRSDFSSVVWRKSSHSSGMEDSDCVEVALVNGRPALRDSKDPDGPILSFTAAEWAAFLTTLRNHPGA